MTELETIARAKMYLDMLSRGVDPLTGQPVGSSDVVNQVRISKCLQFVSGVLGQVLDNGGVGAVEKEPFRITPAELARVELSSHPVSISGLCQRITAATGNPRMANLSSVPVLNWLEARGLLAKVDAQKGRARRPTRDGVQLGIFTQEQTGANGPYTAVLYNDNAQRFILEHFWEILG